MTLPFVKMHAHGDDFLIIDRRGLDDPISAQVARRLGNRHTGIGFNQLAVVLDCADAAARIKFWNPNGTPLQTCGSATRGVAERLMHEAGTDSIVLRTDRGLLTCVRESGRRVSVNMGAPSLGWAAVPLAESMDTLYLPLEGDPAACSMGNPHCTFFVADLGAVDVATLGPALETHVLFPARTNVHFCPGHRSWAYSPADLGARRRRAARVRLVLLRRGGEWDSPWLARRPRRGAMRRRHSHRAVGRAGRRGVDRERGADHAGHRLCAHRVN